MIFTLIVFLLVVVFMAFFIGENLNNTCTLWLFKTYTDLHIVVLVLIAFGAGIVFSLLLVLISKLRKSMNTITASEPEQKPEKTKNREKTEKKLKKLQAKEAKKNKKSKGIAPVEGSSDPTIIADK